MKTAQGDFIKDSNDLAAMAYWTASAVLSRSG
ncbi:hypothetical protein SFHH103_02704 [Sinorhizobium fredii HH103]|uniref:Uncharacterized protein n=1 Tax=Sinorhizobium fredii (strain HH103) TaxID=1117943 RepID=G9ABA8_SINF1|nr:hypothetical protein SFHH103_02704 [Sinorhizobium fredii HH103]